MVDTPLLDAIDDPTDLRRLPPEVLRQVADELRAETIDAVSVTGGHLGAGLGVVELTVALHYVFDTPRDKIVWDVGHQAYPHKILTGRRSRIRTLRQPGGLSGFTKRSESPHDAFGAAHSSTSISAALGMATARDLAGEDFHVVAVIGDGAMSAGMAYEAMNNAGAMNARLIVILNDNDMSIATATGAMHHYLSRVISSQSYMTFRHVANLVMMGIRVDVICQWLILGAAYPVAAMVVGPVKGAVLLATYWLGRTLPIWFGGTLKEDQRDAPELLRLLLTNRTAYRHAAGSALLWAAGLALLF